MGRELFKQPLIEDPNLPDDNDRIALGVPSSAGGKNIIWSYFKTLIQSIASTFNWIDFTPQAVRPTEQEGRIFYNDANKAYEAYSDIAGVQPMRLGRSIWAKVINQSGFPIPKGSVVKVVGLSAGLPLVELAQANDLSSVRKTIGITLHSIANTESGYLAVFDAILGVNTAGMSANDLVYLSADVPGGFTNVIPSPPNHTMSIGFVSVVDASNGVIGVRFSGFEGNDTSTNSQGIINGIVTKTPNVEVSVSGGIIYADVTNEEEPLDNLPFMLDDMRYLMNTTTNTGPGGSARVIVPPGADSETLQKSTIYLYLNGASPEIGIAITPPSIPYAKICDLMVFDAARTVADGKPDGYRRSNDAIDLKGGTREGSIGLIRDMMAAIREKLGANWISGQDGTPIVDNSNIKLALSAGVGRQFRESLTPAFDGNLYQIYNDDTNTVTYEASTNLTDIVSDANGVTLLSNNKYYTIRVNYQLNSNGVGNNVIATRPLGSYATAEQALSDPLNYTVAMNDPVKEEIVYPLYDLIIGRTGPGGSTINLVELRSLRSKLARGGSGGGSTAISNVKTISKVVAFNDGALDFDYDENYGPLYFQNGQLNFSVNSNSNGAFSWFYRTIITDGNPIVTPPEWGSWIVDEYANDSAEYGTIVFYDGNSYQFSIYKIRDVFAITGYIGTGLNTYIDVTFSEGAFGANDGTTPVAVSDLKISNFVSGRATAISISSITKTTGGALTGGETTIRCYLSVTGSPYGVETFEIQPTGGSSIYDVVGESLPSNQTTGTITLDNPNLLESKTFDVAGDWSLVPSSVNNTSEINNNDGGVNKLYLLHGELTVVIPVAFKTGIFSVGDTIKVTLLGVNTIQGNLQLYVGDGVTPEYSALVNDTDATQEFSGIDTTGYAADYIIIGTKKDLIEFDEGYVRQIIIETE